MKLGHVEEAVKGLSNYSLKTAVPRQPLYVFVILLKALCPVSVSAKSPVHKLK